MDAITFHQLSSIITDVIYFGFSGRADHVTALCAVVAYKDKAVMLVNLSLLLIAVV